MSVGRTDRWVGQIGYVLNVGRGYVINVGRGYVIHNHELINYKGGHRAARAAKKHIHFEIRFTE